MSNIDRQLKKAVYVPTDEEAIEGFDSAFHLAMQRIHQQEAREKEHRHRYQDAYKLATAGAIALAAALIVLLTPIAIQTIRHYQERQVANQIFLEYTEYHPWVDEMAAFSFSIDHYAELSDYFISPSKENEKVIEELTLTYVSGREYHDIAGTGFYDRFLYEIPRSQVDYFQGKVAEYEKEKLLNYLF